MCKFVVNKLHLLSIPSVETGPDLTSIPTAANAFSDAASGLAVVYIESSEAHTATPGNAIVWGNLDPTSMYIPSDGDFVDTLGDS